MKLVVKLDYNRSVVFPADQAGVIVPALSTGKFFTADYSSKGYKPTEDDSPLEFVFEPDEKFGERPEPLVALQKQRDESEQKYLEMWSKGQEYQKKIRELETKLEQFKQTVEEI
jgi:hypothetical protein